MASDLFGSLGNEGSLARHKAILANHKVIPNLIRDPF